MLRLTIDFRFQPARKGPVFLPGISFFPFAYYKLRFSLEYYMCKGEQGMKKESSFIKTFRQIARRYETFEAWNDFITISACLISNIADKRHFAERDKLWRQTISRYDDKDKELFGSLWAEIAYGLTRHPEEDFLGIRYTELGINSKSLKQEFTPGDLSALMSRLVIRGTVMDVVRKQGYVVIDDPTCGAGGLFLQAIQDAATEITGAGLDWHDHILVTGQDISFVAAMMCYIQLSLVGVAGYIKVGNTITDPMCEKDSLDSYWFTPTYFSDTWQWRRAFQLLRKLE